MVLRPKRILWPTDFSDLSLQAARYARGLCETFGAELHIVHAVLPPVATDVAVAMPAEVPVTYADQELLEVSRRQISELVQRHFPRPESVVIDAFFGNPWSAICHYAERAEINLIVVSTHGRTGLKHVLIGSTAERIVQHAPCPVLVVKSSERGFVFDE